MAAGTLTLDAFARRLDDAARGLGDLTTTMQECANVTKVDMYEKVAEGVSPDGTPHAPLRREREHGHALFAGTPLAGTSLHQSLLGGPYHVEEIGPASFAVGTTHPLAAVHNFGATVSVPARRRGPGEKPWVFQTAGGQQVFTRRIRAFSFSLPARFFMGFSPAALARCDEIIGNRVADLIAGEGRTP